MILWEKDELTVNEIAQKLILNTNTVTPLLKRLEKQGIIQRKRSEQDERKVFIHLTNDGENLKKQAADIPTRLLENFEGSEFNSESFNKMKCNISSLVDTLKNL